MLTVAVYRTYNKDHYSEFHNLLGRAQAAEVVELAVVVLVVGQDLDSGLLHKKRVYLLRPV